MRDRNPMPSSNPDASNTHALDRTTSESVRHRERYVLSYANKGHAGPLGRTVIRALEAMTGMRRLHHCYQCAQTMLGTERAASTSGHRDNGHSGPAICDPQVWSVAMQAMDIESVIHGHQPSIIPPAGPLVVVANHPFGLVDGVAICDLIARVRTDFRVLAHAAVGSVPEIAHYMFPLDFSENKLALAINLETRARARRWLRDGGAIIIFPAGGVSTAKPLGRAVDPPWTPFVSTLITNTEATVLPVYFPGQNSWLFQIASHVSLTLRLGLLAFEATRRLGKHIDLVVGEPIPFDALRHHGDRKSLINDLRTRTYALDAVKRIGRPRSGNSTAEPTQRR